MCSAETNTLVGQVALITGGTRGLGVAIASGLAQAGCSVFVCGRNRPADLEARLHFCKVDIRDAEASQALVETVVAEAGRLDVLVNNAGGSPHAETLFSSPRFIDAILKLNLMAPLYLAQAAARQMIAQASGGSIVNIASLSGTRPSPGTAVYGAAKAGLLNLTQSLAQEWRAHGVRVNAVVPGLMETESTGATYGADETRHRVMQSIPMERFGKGRDVADTVLWLCSVQARAFTGMQIAVDGGGERPRALSKGLDRSLRSSR